MDGIKHHQEANDFEEPFFSHSAEDTQIFGGQLGKILAKNSVVCFFGDLGAGKTTLIKGLVSSLTNTPIEQVHSPTYTYLNIYPGPLPVYHFDLYRLNSSDDFLDMGFEEYFSAGGICLVEWSERIEELLPKNIYKIKITHISPSQRKIEIARNIHER